MKRGLIRSAAMLLAVILLVLPLSGCSEIMEQYMIDSYGDYYDDDNGTGSSQDNDSDNSSSDPIVISTNVLGDAMRDRFTKINGNGNDTVTVMIYMCASNLESESGFATQDIKEMMRATASSKLNIVIATGGTTRWQNTSISPKTNQYHVISGGRLDTVEPKLGQQDMTDPDTLESFINYSVSNYEANRYMLILWDHGAGSVDGWGYDEYNYSDTLTIDELAQALYNCGVKFDFVGFDACLMSTMEIACVLYDFADYMIASEDYESGYGWEYENWLSDLAQNTSIPTAELGKTICDDFVVESGREDAIMALTDLSYMKLVYSTWRDFAYAEKDELLKADYSWEVEASDRARISLDDFFNFAESLLSTQAEIQDMRAIASSFKDSETAAALISAMENAVVYCAANSGCAEMTGMAVTLPYNDSETYKKIQTIFSNVGFEQQYIDFLGEFVGTAGTGAFDWSDWYNSYEDYGTWSDYYGDDSYDSSDYGWGDWGGWDSYNSNDYGWSDYDYYDYFFGSGDSDGSYYDFYDYGNAGGDYSDYYGYYGNGYQDYYDYFYGNGYDYGDYSGYGDYGGYSDGYYDDGYDIWGDIFDYFFGGY